MAIEYRPAVAEDTPFLFEVLLESFADLSQRLGKPAITGGDDPEVMDSLWKKRQPLFEHLERTAAHSWVAEKEGRLLGYARTIVREGVQELTEFFVRPGEQSAGVGKELLMRAFPDEGVHLRVIIATTDDRAQARYLKTGVYPRFPIKYFMRKAQPAEVEGELVFEAMEASPQVIDALNAIDMEILGHTRRIDHEWLLEEREGYLYRNQKEVVGYGYLGEQSGPFALVDGQYYPAVLAHAETESQEFGEEFGVEVPLINKAAVDYLLERGFRMDPFFALFMSDRPFGRFDQYLFTSPPFFI